MTLNQTFTIHHRKTGEVAVIHLNGRLTLGDGTSALREALRTAMKDCGDILLDMSGVTYIDSAGLGQLVEGHSLAVANGRAMKLLSPHKRVDSLLHITKLNSTFETFEDEAAAIASFRK